MLNWEVERTTMDKSILICCSKSNLSFLKAKWLWLHLTLMIACLSLWAILPNHSLSCLTCMWLEISLTDWPPDPEILKSTSAPCWWAQSGPVHLGCVLFLRENSTLSAPRGESYFDLPLFSLSYLGLWNSEPQSYQQPCHGPKCLLLAAISHQMVWPPERGVRGPLPCSKSQPPPGGCWTILPTPWGFDAGPAAAAYLSSSSPVLLCCA